MSREGVWTGVLLFLGCAAIFASYRVWIEKNPPRPAATGDVGMVTVYGQAQSGPTPLQANRRRRLLRPQDFAFQVTANGTGPRRVQVELEYQGKLQLVHQEELFAPLDRHSLDHVLHLGETAPDQVVIYVTIEGPHTRPLRFRFPVTLVGGSHPFWEAGAATGSSTAAKSLRKTKK